MGLLIKILLFSLVARMLWRALKPPAGKGSGSEKGAEKRFDPTGRNVADADFEELKE